MKSVVLYDGSGNRMDVQDGVAVPAGTAARLRAGKDEGGFGRIQLVESKVGAQVCLDAVAYAARFSPAFSDPFYQQPGPPVYTPGALAYASYYQGTPIYAAAPGFGTVVYPTASMSFVDGTAFIGPPSPDDAPGGGGCEAVRVFYIGVDGNRYTVDAPTVGTSLPSTISTPVAPATICGVIQIAGGTPVGAIGVGTSDANATYIGIDSGASPIPVIFTLVFAPGKTVRIDSITTSLPQLPSLFFKTYDYVSAANQTLLLSGWIPLAASTDDFTMVFRPPVSCAIPATGLGTLSTDATSAQVHFTEM